MSTNVFLICAALVAALVLTLQHRPRLLPVIALVVSGFEALRALRVLHFGVAGLPLDLILGAVLVVCGAVVLLRTSHKPSVSAATVVTLVGALQVLSRLRP